MASVFVSPKAVEDLDRIKVYIKDDLKNPSAYKSTVLKIIDAYEMLASFPNMGAALKTDNVLLKKYRQISAAEYIVFYRVEGDSVYVVRILHRLTDFVSILLSK